MLAGLSIALALLAQAASLAAADAAPPTAAPPTATVSAAAYGPPAPAPPKKPVKAVPAAADKACPPPAPPSANRQEIVVCAQRPQGYRLDPDVVEARREMRSGGRPTGPERMKDKSCASVGPAGCMGAAGINVIAAAVTAARMAARLAKGEEIGSMFRTTPEPTEYQLYLEAKHRREAREAEAAAKAKAAQAAQQAGAGGQAGAAGQADGVEAKGGPAD